MIRFKRMKNHKIHDQIMFKVNKEMAPVVVCGHFEIQDGGRSRNGKKMLPMDFLLMTQ